MARALGTDDSVNTCDCCGKTNLKFTVTIELDSGDVVHYGQICAGRNTGKTRPQISAEIKSHKAAQEDAALARLKPGGGVLPSPGDQLEDWRTRGSQATDARQVRRARCVCRRVAGRNERHLLEDHRGS